MSEPIDPVRVGRHTDQERLVRHLGEVVRRRLSGEDRAGSRLVGREPREQIVSGVLPPKRQSAPPASSPDIPDEPGVPIDELPASELGLTLLVEPEPGCDQLRFNVQARFALYLQEFPTYAEQQSFVSGDEDTPTETDSAPELAPPPPAEPARGGSTRRTGRGVRLVPVFRRVDVVTTFEVEVRVPVDDFPVLGTETAALTQAINDAVNAIPSTRLYRPLSGRGQTVPVEAVTGGESAYEAELASRADFGRLPPLADVGFTVLVQRDIGPGRYRVSLTLQNDSEEAASINGFRPSLSLYDAGFEAQIQGGNLGNYGYALAQNDYRIHPEVYSYGRFCVGIVDPSGQQVRTSTWPTFRQAVFESRPEAAPSFVELIENPLGPLEEIADEMGSYLGEWDRYLGSGVLEASARAACAADRLLFADEVERFKRGIELLRSDARIRQAFVLANRTFALLNTTGGLDIAKALSETEPDRIQRWYLFQIVFIVCGLAALAARDPDAPEAISSELEAADVLWFPTGGGKSEAFLGLLTVALFFDRLRSKEIGVTGIIRFPLRMLSVQQLDRVLKVVVAAERIRSAHQVGAQPFELGYLVGRFNTPNKITDGSDERWRDVRWMAKQPDEWRREHVVITVCPYCDSERIILDPDPADVRLYHRCESCDRRLPVAISDDEVYRYLPAVVVATVDKLATISFNPHFSHFTHGPAYRCPRHGYVTFTRGPKRAQRCLARTYCEVDPKDWDCVDAVDPAPALIIQDELHLLAEDLGTFSAHYETLWQHLTRAGSGKPSKIVAATATISDYENQVLQLYALEPRRFPTEGFEEDRSFYAQRHDELARRVFFGALPAQLDAAGLSVQAGMICRAELERLRSLDPGEVVGQLGFTHYQPADVADVLFQYELQLFYVNRKTDGDRIAERAARAGKEGLPARFAAATLNGTTPLADISATIRRVGTETLGTPAESRLAMIAGTSLVSHGVDLDRLNILHMSGFPSTVAYYVQATSRAGRSDVGAVFVAFSPFPRDRAAFHFFDPQHRYVNQLVEPVSLNRFSVHGPLKTASGLMAAVIINHLARDPALNPTPRDGDRLRDFTVADNFKAALRANSTAVESRLGAEVREAYGLGCRRFDPILADNFARVVDDRVVKEIEELRGGIERTIQTCFLRRPPTSFRDIDEAVSFSPYARIARNEFAVLSGRADPRKDPDAEITPAGEEEDRDGT